MPKPPTTDQGLEAQNIEKLTLMLAHVTAPTQVPQARSLHSLLQKERLLVNKPCPSCGSIQAIQVSGVGPHYAGLRCVNCNRFIKWLPKPKPEGAA